MVERVGLDAVENYGIADVGAVVDPYKTVQLKGLIEKPSKEDAPSDLAVLGRYILPSRILDLLEHTSPGVGEEIQLTDALDELIKKDGLNALETEASTYDCGTKEGVLGANIAVGMQDSNNGVYLRKLRNL